MSNIRKVVKSSWTEKSGRYGFIYRVYYTNKEPWRKDRIVRYTYDQQLPLTVLNFVLNAGNVETEYIPEDRRGESFLSLKQETYKK